MKYFNVDSDKCLKDGICVNTCPCGIILSRKDGTPAMLKIAEQYCIQCGHCVSVCPAAAINLAIMKTDDCPEFRKNELPTAAQTEVLLRARRSIRKYKKTAVDRSLISRLIDTSSFAPAGHNIRALRWLVFDNPAMLEKINRTVVDWMKFAVSANPALAQSLHLENVIEAFERGEDKILRGAPALAAVIAPKNLPIADSSATIALTYLELAAFGNGLGACWAGYFHLATMYYPEMSNVIGLPVDFKCCGGMMLGYPQYSYSRIPTRPKQTMVFNLNA